MEDVTRDLNWPPNQQAATDNTAEKIIGSTTVHVKDCIKTSKLVVTVKIKGLPMLRFRMWLGIIIIKLGCKIAYSECEVTDSDDKVTDKATDIDDKIKAFDEYMGITWPELKLSDSGKSMLVGAYCAGHNEGYTQSCKDEGSYYSSYK